MQNGTFETSALVQFVLIQEIVKLWGLMTASGSSSGLSYPHCEGRREWTISGWGHWAPGTGQTSQHSTLATSPPQQGSGGPLHFKYPCFVLHLSLHCLLFLITELVVLVWKSGIS